jgi:L-lactate utilization protein LutB
VYVVLLCINVGVCLHDCYHFLHLRAHSTVGTTMPSNGPIPGMSVYGKREEDYGKRTNKFVFSSS